MGGVRIGQLGRRAKRAAHRRRGPASLLTAGACSFVLPRWRPRGRAGVDIRSVSRRRDLAAVAPISARRIGAAPRRRWRWRSIRRAPGTPVSWDNPDTTLKGNFTPVGQPFVKSDEICRAFLATVRGQGAASSLQGTACRPSGGEWAIKDVRPFKKA